MDSSQIAAISMAILTPLSPYLARIGEELAKEVGKAIFARGRKLYQTILKKSEQDDDKSAQQALETLDKNPKDAQPLLCAYITQRVESDPAFAKDLSAQVDDLRIFLFECLQEKFGTDDLREVYFRLGIGWNDLVGGVAGHNQKAIALIEQVNRREKVAELITAMWKVYPGLRC